ncbi:predicted protein [Aspergillus nidulans FGSC A4]|uniref:Uncharacterized protein n=1 Tax=Emericella nidulans (strain FGSC A4 / ATCC 38163 / CBS 112.46 / NRRL 194 / M139) TaxID=227321 RepID=Q5BFM8_EMENI|nr:hypothetical protein [Aspergillus nidulans FGSC A4]EAA65428.1 predicted protein [Aspergillus nidulans FGSC A4]CBF89055.1 TPA: conserved hypothetical protein [Aspergillus nidulans FGSC A4]|eukprot:XP_658256.1 predicted protein [Aspergillus nidulans FGSC A4]
MFFTKLGQRRISGTVLGDTSHVLTTVLTRREAFIRPSILPESWSENRNLLETVYGIVEYTVESKILGNALTRRIGALTYEPWSSHLEFSPDSRFFRIMNAEYESDSRTLISRQSYAEQRWSMEIVKQYRS